MRFMILVFIVFHLILKSRALDLSERTLRSLHILFRHGERSPSKSYTNDPYRNFSWPGGWDQLSNNGKSEMYELGKYFRKIYNSFLSEYYVTEDVYVLSSYADRCHMSAQLLLAGLFPPVKEQIWNIELLWQPIPVHSIERSEDNKIAIKKKCPKYEAALQEVWTSEAMKLINKQNRELFEYISLHSGDNVHDIRTVETLFNTLEIEALNNLSLPAWTKSVLDKMKSLAALSLATFSKTDFMKRMHGGVLLKEILIHMLEKRDGKLKPDRKIFLYSGHDLTVVSLMRALGYEELLKPEFGASVILEHHSVNNQDFVKVLYKDNPTSNVSEKPLNNCAEPCTLNNFHTVLNNFIPDDWEQECNE